MKIYTRTGDAGETFRRERRVESLVRKPERRGGVGAPAAEAGCDRHALREASLPPRLDAGLGREQLQGAGHDRVAREPAHGWPRSRPELDSVGQVDPLEDRADLVLAVLAHGADDER